MKSPPCCATSAAGRTGPAPMPEAGPVHMPEAGPVHMPAAALLERVINRLDVGRCGLRLLGRAGHRRGEFVAADEEIGDRDRGQADGAAGPERPLEAAGERRGWCGALVEQGAGMGGRDRGGYGDADRAAEL